MIGRGWLIVLLVTTVVQADDEGWGTLRGRFVFDGEPPRRAQLDVNKDMEVCGKQPLYDESLIVDEKNKGVMNVLVYLRSKTERVHPEYGELIKKQAVVKHQGCRFEPHLALAMIGQEVLFKNDDQVSHNSNVVPVGEASLSPLIPPPGDFVVTYRRPQSIPQPITCNIHPWEKGYLFVHSNHYAALSSMDGSFELKNLPTGVLEFKAWQESWDGKTNPDSHPTWDRGRFKATINRDSTTDLGTIRLGPKYFGK